MPGESETDAFGGNSNWRGPVWMPVNYLLVESLYEFHRYYGDDFLVEFPVGSGQMATLTVIADELRERLARLFLRGADGRRPCLGRQVPSRAEPSFGDHLLFNEYFHGETGAGCRCLAPDRLDRTDRATAASARSPQSMSTGYRQPEDRGTTVAALRRKGKCA